MKSKTIPIFFLLSVLLFFLPGCFQESEKKFEYEWEHEGILFQSDFNEPKILLREFALKPKIIVSPELSMSKPNENPEIFNNSVIPFYTVAFGNDRNAVQLLMFVEDGKLQECETNFGDLKTQVFLREGECTELVEKWNADLIVFFPLPDPSIKRSSVLLEENKATIKAKNTEEQAVLSLSLLEQLFPNAQEILKRAKEKLRELK